MNLVKKYYVFFILCLSVLFVFAYDSNRTSKIQNKQENEVYDVSLSSIDYETSQIDINLKYGKSSTEFTISTTEEYDNNTASTEFIETSSSGSSTQFTISTTEENENTTNNTEDYLTVSSTTEISSSTQLAETSTIDICETAIITDVKVISKPFSLNISWVNSVQSEYCEFIYKIESLNENDIYESNSFIFINDLIACKYYEGTISILYRENVLNSRKFNATTSEAVDPVEQIEFHTIEPHFDISWLPSRRTELCIKYYKWKHFQYESLIDEKNVFSTNVIIAQPSGCFNNTFSIFAAINDSFISQPQNKTLVATVNNPPIFVSAKTSANSATTTWTFDKICEPQSFWLNYTSDNNFFTVIEKHFPQTDKEIIIEVNDLFAFTNYTIQGAIKYSAGLTNWSKKSPVFQTQEKEPDSPEYLNTFQFKNNTLLISWKRPERWNGYEISYILIIEFLGLNYTLMEGCPEISHTPVNRELESNSNFYFYDPEPASLYRISISAKSSGGIGRSIDRNIITNEAVPDKPILVWNNFVKHSIKNIYNVTLYVEWRTPCQVNGITTHYVVQLTNCNDSNSKYEIIPVSSLKDYEYSFKNLLPETNYNFNVQLHLQSKYNEAQLSILSPAGIPDIAETIDLPIPNGTIENPETTANVYIKNNMFNSKMGEIIYYAIIVAQAGCEEKPTFDEYLLDRWPKVEGSEMCSDKSKPYQATKIKWNPFKINNTKKNNDIKVFILGTETNCSADICNRPLTPNSNYSIKIRGFTRNGFSDTKLIYFNTASFVDGFQLGLIVGLIVGILAIAFIIAAAIFYTKGKLNFTGWPRMESNTNISPAPLPVPLKKFKSHYAKMIENSGKIKNEFQLLSTISSDVTLSTKTAMLPINRKKNRYNNILPYDQTRVKLYDTSITASDYVNASYIKGYNDLNEYIATQGPTESTSTAFWQMIIEQNIKLIVMLTQFVECGKDKCYKYFPDLNESHDYLNVIRVTCIEEMLLPSYNKRTFKITKGKEIYTIIHLQFNLWPDFGVPQELKSIMEFSKKVKEFKLKKPSVIVMHCSAGVGRTGTLIAVDILMQAIRDKRKVDIFGTVLNLRKQRMNMVQSEVQYEFLYKCINYLLSDNTKNSLSHLHSKIQLDQIEENQISESNMLQTFKT